MAKSTRSAASYIAEERNKTGKNPFKGLTMSAMKSKWSKMTPEQRSKNVQNFRNAAKSSPKTDAKKKPVAKAKPVAKPEPKVNNQSNKDGTYGKSLPSNPKLKTQTPKPKPTKSRGGQRARVNKKATKQTLQGIKNTVSKVSSSLFNKEGDKKTVGGTQYIFQKGRWRKYTV